MPVLGSEIDAENLTLTFVAEFSAPVERYGKSGKTRANWSAGGVRRHGQPHSNASSSRSAAALITT